MERRSVEEGTVTATTASVLTTVQKFEASKFVVRTPMNTTSLRINSPVMERDSDYYDDDQRETSTPSPPPSSPDLPPAIPAIGPPNSDEDAEQGEQQQQQQQQEQQEENKSKVKKQPPKTAPKPKPKVAVETKPSPKKESTSSDAAPPKLHQPDLSKVPKKSSLKKTRSKSKLVPKPQNGLWFNMNDQYPIENFSGRERILGQIHEVVHGPKSRDVRPISRTIVLAGGPGLGKTEIARKFAFKFYVDCNGKGNVIWLDASSKESIVQSLLLLLDKELTAAAAEPGSVYDLDAVVSATNNGKENAPKKTAKKKSTPESELEEKIQQVVTHRTFQENPTLFVFDNAVCEEEILEFLPKLAPHGHIPNVLVTSNFEQSWNNARVIKVAEFEFKEAVEFLLALFQDCQGFTKFQAEDLAKELHRFPPLMQKARRIVLRYLLSHGDSDRAILKLEKNIGLVRRLKGEGIVLSTEVELAVLATDRAIYYEDDPYIREYDGELRNHQIAQQIHQLEALLPKALERNDISVLGVNLDSYVIAMLSSLIGKHSRILGVYDTENSDQARVDLLKQHLNTEDENLIQRNRIELRLIEIPTVKPPKQPKTSTLLDKIRSADKQQQYDLILGHQYLEQDLNSVRKLLKPNGGLFISYMSSPNVSSILKKSDTKKIQIKIMKHDFPELLVTASRLL